MSTTPIPPVPGDSTDDAVFVGRGVELHGVPMHGRPDPEQARLDLDGDPVTYEVKPEQPAPVPVFLVPGSTSEQRALRVIRLSLRDTEPVMLLSQNEARVRARLKLITNTVNDIIWVSGAPHTANPNDGVPITFAGANGFVEFTNETALWATRDATSPQNPLPVAILVDYVVQQH